MKWAFSFLLLVLFVFSKGSATQAITPLQMIEHEKANQKIQDLTYLIQPVTVAVIDSGLMLMHPSFVGKLAINEKEKAFAVGDWDLNGFKNDVIGWDFITDSAGLFDTYGHGTHVAGIVLSVNPLAKILPIRVLDKNGDGSPANVVKAIHYAVQRGAKIINLSLGALDIMHKSKAGYSAAIQYARKHDVLVVVAAGNDNSDNDKLGYYPSNVWEDNLISVCSVGVNNVKSQFSNYGKWRVHLCAPGENILSANVDYQSGMNFIFKSGTSMAAPFVAGAASVLMGINPLLKPYQVRNILMESSSRGHLLLSNVSQTDGVLNLNNAIDLVFKTATDFFEEIVQ